MSDGKNIPADSDIKRIRQRINDTLRKKGLNQQDLHDKSGLAEGTISKICSEKSRAIGINADSLYKISKALDVSADYLLGLSDVAERDANINNIGINDEAYKALRALYGDHDITKEIMNTFLSVFIANDGELAKKFKEYMIELTERSSAENTSNDYEKKIALYQLQMLFSNDISPMYKEIACKHFRFLYYYLWGEFLGYCIGKEDQEESWVFYEHKKSNKFPFESKKLSTNEMKNYEKLAKSNIEMWDKKVERFIKSNGKEKI